MQERPSPVIWSLALQLAHLPYTPELRATRPGEAAVLPTTACFWLASRGDEFDVTCGSNRRLPHAQEDLTGPGE